MPRDAGSDSDWEEPAALRPGETFPDLDLPDNNGHQRKLSEIASGDPVVLVFSRGWWCPKEQRAMRGLVQLQDEFEVAYAKIVVVSIDPPEVQSAFRAGLAARFAFLSDTERRWIDRLDLLEHTDTTHHPYRPAAFSLFPDLRIHAAYNGYYSFGRPTAEELRQDMRAISREIRPDWQP